MARFFQIIDELRNRAAIMNSDAESLESGRWRWGDESAGWAETFREKARHLLRLSDAYEKRDE